MIERIVSVVFSDEEGESMEAVTAILDDNDHLTFVGNETTSLTFNGAEIRAIVNQEPNPEMN